MSPIDAARLVVRDYPGGAASLAPRIGKAACTLSHEVSANFKSAKLGLEDAVTISVLADDRRILNAFADELSCMVIPLPRLDQEGCTLAAISAKAQKFASYLQEVTAASADGVITDNEMQRVNAAYADLVVTGQQLQALMLARNQASKSERTEA